MSARTIVLVLWIAGCGVAQPPRAHRTAVTTRAVVECNDAGTDAPLVLEESERAIVDAALATTDAFVVTVDETALARRGRRAYARACESCHRDGPRLVGRSMDASRVRARVRHGGARMPAIPASRVSDVDLTAICAFLAAP